MKILNREPKWGPRYLRYPSPRSDSCLARLIPLSHLLLLEPFEDFIYLFVSLRASASGGWLGAKGEAGPPLRREPRTLRPRPEPNAGALPAEPPGAPGGVFHKSTISGDSTTKYGVMHFKEKVEKDLFSCYHDNHQPVSCLQRVLPVCVDPGSVQGACMSRRTDAHNGQPRHLRSRL